MKLKRNPEVKVKLANANIIESDNFTTSLNIGLLDTEDRTQWSIEDITEDFEVALLAAAFNDYNTVGNVIMAIEKTVDDYSPKTKADMVKWFAGKADDALYDFVLLIGFDCYANPKNAIEQMLEHLASSSDN